ncbi:hypothetical protein [Synechococcus sp. BS56D]|nr:hypothetical protein [Synechococcus sp. BS56D]
MLSRLFVGLLAATAAITPLPHNAQEGSADDLGGMSISLYSIPV